MQVDNSDAAHTQRDLPINPGGVTVALGLRRPWKQTQTEAEDLLTNDGHGLWGESKRNQSCCGRRKTEVGLRSRGKRLKVTFLWRL